jgi:hypothetical protein
MNDFILLHQNDNVVVALKNMEVDAQIEVNGKQIQLKSAIAFGHKIAIKSIKAGERIFKYGLSIGIATNDITAGEHVHVQNLRTDYTPKQL